MIEDKIRQLSPEKQKEVEDFVDFLLARSGPAVPPLTGQTGPVAGQEPVRPAPVIMAGEELFRSPGPSPCSDRADTGPPAVELSDLQYRKRTKPDPDKLLEWIG